MIDIATLTNCQRYEQLTTRLRKRNIVRGLRCRSICGMVFCYSEEVGREITGVEVGVKRGHISRILLNNVPLLRKLVMVDPWAVYPPDHPDRARYSYARRSEKRWNNMANDVLYKMQPYGDRAEVFRGFSMQAAAHMCALGRQFDFVYIDAQHDYPAVLEDCEAWWPLVAPGGFLSGDDYFAADHMRREHNGVGPAVEEFSRRVGLPIIELHRNFFIQKPCAA